MAPPSGKDARQDLPMALEDDLHQLPALGASDLVRPVPCPSTRWRPPADLRPPKPEREPVSENFLARFLRKLARNCPSW